MTPTDQQRPLVVFLSHNSADKAAVEYLAEKLAQEPDITPWFDRWNLIPGDPWQEALEEALDHCDVCLVFVGPTGIGPWQNEEMRDAIDRRVARDTVPFRVVPLLLPGAEKGERGALPRFLSRGTWVEFRESLDDEGEYRRLLAGIRGLPPGREASQPRLLKENPYRGLLYFDVQHAPFTPRPFPGEVSPC